MMRLSGPTDATCRRLRGKQDIPSVVPVEKTAPVDLVEISDVSMNGGDEDIAVDSDDSLEKRIFGQSKTHVATSSTSSKQSLTAADLAMLAADPPVGPAPQEYPAATRKAAKAARGVGAEPVHSTDDEGGDEQQQEDKGGNANGERKTKKKKKKVRKHGAHPPKVPMKSKKSKPNTDATVGDTEKTVDPIAKYIGVTGVPMIVLRNRAHSNAWHLEKKFRLRQGWDNERAKLAATKYAKKMIERWEKAVGYRG
eukprot:9500215-Pyramimonas_sp.AAC.1